VTTVTCDREETEMDLPSTTALTAARVAAQQAAAARLTSFTPDATTVDIIRALARGQTRYASAQSLRISESTVRRKLAQARQGWGVETNTEVVVTAVRVGLI
jgi:DNA-binding NarL/FixJ family response regulator